MGFDSDAAVTACTATSERSARELLAGIETIVVLWSVLRWCERLGAVRGTR